MLTNSMEAPLSRQPLFLRDPKRAHVFVEFAAKAKQAVRRRGRHRKQFVSRDLKATVWKKRKQSREHDADL